MYTDNPTRDFLVYDSIQARERMRRPHCCICDGTIFGGKAVNYNGDWFCEDHENRLWDFIRIDFLEDTE